MIINVTNVTVVVKIHKHNSVLYTQIFILGYNQSKLFQFLIYSDPLQYGTDQYTPLQIDTSPDIDQYQL